MVLTKDQWMQKPEITKNKSTPAPPRVNGYIIQKETWGAVP